jgi:hypothetical protein
VFCISWQHHVMNILNRPHAPAVVFMGGPLHWIARKFVNNDLIKQALGGLSIQASVHQQGYLNTASDDYHRTDHLTTGKECTLYGFIPSSSVDTDRTLFPTEAILDKYLDHWTGEWNERCNSIFKDIWSNMHVHNKVIPRTPGQWKQFLQGNNHKS